jgi:hypothetical protein
LRKLNNDSYDIRTQITLFSESKPTTVHDPLVSPLSIILWKVEESQVRIGSTTGSAGVVIVALITTHFPTPGKGPRYSCTRIYLFCMPALERVLFL